MNRFSIFLAKHSQKIAFASVGIALGTSYCLQPYYEVFIRWSLVSRSGSMEKRPLERIQRIADEVSRLFVLDPKRKSSLDVFLTGLDQSVNLGSLHSSGYAFVGLPEFAAYSDASEISVEGDHFYTSKFPHGPYSPIGKQRLQLMILPDDALRFLVARELVRLGAKTHDGQQLSLSGRRRAMFTISGITGSLYAAFQLSYLLNRTYRLPSRMLAPIRVLIYMGLSSFCLFSQWQVALALRRYNAFTADHIAAQLDPTLLHGGLSYYDWRVRWNHFWFERAMEMHDKALQRQREVQKKASTKDSDFDPVRAYQDEQEMKAERNRLMGIKGEGSGEDTGYFMPRLASESENTAPPPPPPSLDSSPVQSNPASSSFPYRIHPRISSAGNELWAADGEAVGFGLTELLQNGHIPSSLAFILSLFSQPANSSARHSHLATILSQTPPPNVPI